MGFYRLKGETQPRMRSGIYLKDYFTGMKPKVLPEELWIAADLIQGYSEK